ncbi:MAG: hypothetical protein E6G97_02005 [Alphaproteobacteria bacterium]|nr:MAG: hypothetical protein E6G97_02005 [Alphaproteobacteria bacterium]
MPNQVSNLLDLQLIRRIVARAVSAPLTVKLNRIDLRRDIGMVHANGCPLRLRALLHAGTVDFFHDVLGIHRHLNRETGALDPVFRPRFVWPRTLSRSRDRRRAA